MATLAFNELLQLFKMHRAGRIKPVRKYNTTQSAFTFSKLTIETLEQGVKYVQS